ncbi:MAG: hypothetical protein KDJ20_01445 [Hyphomicrobiales bacterium]|nr:hypothetical protein [Hyphomicrobiales bacterium]MCC2106578.1 hypothetical protein [Hyphomicrobiales bacterium]
MHTLLVDDVDVLVTLAAVAVTERLPDGRPKKVKVRCCCADTFAVIEPSALVVHVGATLVS